MGMINWLKVKASRVRHRGAAGGKGESAIGTLDTESPSQHDLEHDDDLPDGDARAVGLDFVAAIRAHQASKARLSAYVQGQSTEVFDAAEVAQDDACGLGRWLNGPEGASLNETAILDDLRLAHTQFHQLGGRIVQAMQAGNTAEAQHLMASDYHRTSVRMQGKLAELFLSVAPSTEAAPAHA